MAAGLPVVSTTVGAQGLEVSDGAELMLADAPEEFVRKCVQLLGDAPLRERMAVAGRRLAEEKYSWQIITQAWSPPSLARAISRARTKN